MANNSQQFKMWHAVAFAVILVFAIGNKLYSSIWSKTTIILAGKELRVLVADTPRHRFQGSDCGRGFAEKVVLFSGVISSRLC
jgi:hypothetical protein